MEELKITTHAGQYHADELVAINLISVFLNIKPIVTRVSRDDEILEGELPVDIGKGELDHHQADCPTYSDGTRYCAANRVVEKYAAQYYRKNGLSEKAIKWAVEILQADLKPIAEQDNYGPRNHGNTFSCMVSNLNENFNFSNALRFTKPFVIGLVNKAIKRVQIRLQNEDLFNNPKPIVEMKNPIPIDVYPPEVMFVICKSNRGGFNVTSTDEQTHPIVATEGSKGCRFIHHNKFLANFSTLEDARKCAEDSLIKANN